MCCKPSRIREAGPSVVALLRYGVGVLMLLAVAGVLLGPAPARADSVTQLGALPISVDNVVEGTYAVLTVDPEISESAASEWGALSLIIIQSPTGFVFDTTVTCQATVTAGNLTLDSDSVLPLTDQMIVFTVHSASNGDGNQATIRFSGIELGSVAATCASAAPGDATRAGTPPRWWRPRASPTNGPAASARRASAPSISSSPKRCSGAATSSSSAGRVRAP